MDLFVAPGGMVTAIYTEAIDFQTLGTTTITRASHVEPDETGRWFAQIVGGPKLGPFVKRSDALAAEVAWLTRYRLNSAENAGELPNLSATYL